MTDREKGTMLLLVHAKATANLPYFCEAVKSNVILPSTLVYGAIHSYTNIILKQKTLVNESNVSWSDWLNTKHVVTTLMFSFHNSFMIFSRKGDLSNIWLAALNFWVAVAVADCCDFNQ